MTPSNSQSGGSGFGAGLLGGLFVSAIVFAIGGAGVFVIVKKKSERAVEGWKLVPIIVAAEDIEENTAVTVDMISQRSIPEQFVTASSVKPDSASYILNQKTLFPLQAGDPMLWADFETNGGQPVLFAAKDIAVGATMTPEDFEDRVIPKELFTESWVQTRDREEAVGRMLLAPFRKGDPILWTHLKAAGAK